MIQIHEYTSQIWVGSGTFIYGSWFGGPVVSGDPKSCSWQTCWMVMFCCCCGERTLLFEGCSCLQRSPLHVDLQQRHNCCKLLLFCFFRLCVVGHTLMASICVLGVGTDSSLSSSSILINTELQRSIMQEDFWE